MFATWILCLFLLMIAPYLTLEAGILRKKKCAAHIEPGEKLTCVVSLG